MNLEVVVPSSVTPVLTDLLTFFAPGQKVVCKLYEIDTGSPPSAGDAPIYFGVGYRSGITSIDCINLFCHPSRPPPPQACSPQTISKRRAHKEVKSSAPQPTGELLGETAC